VAEPTRKQKLLIQAIYFLAKDANGRPPSFREVAERLGLRSTDGITSGLLRLERAGWLVRDHGSPRSMWVTVEGELAAGLRVVEEPKDDYEGEPPDWENYRYTNSGAQARLITARDKGR
jgi:SOS-response transcriptional repressor LexA